MPIRSGPLGESPVFILAFAFLKVGCVCAENEGRNRRSTTELLLLESSLELTQSERSSTTDTDKGTSSANNHRSGEASSDPPSGPPPWDPPGPRRAAPVRQW